MVQISTCDQGRRAVDATIGTESMHGDPRTDLQDQQVAIRVEEERSRLGQLSHDLGHFPAIRDAIVKTRRRYISTALRERIRRRRRVSLGWIRPR